MVGIGRNQLVSIYFFLAASVAFAHKDSDVLPKGIFRARVVNAIGEPVVTRFDNSGTALPLLAPLNRKIGASTLAAADKNMRTLYDSLNTYEPGLGDQLYSADLSADSKLLFHQLTTAVEYGLSERVSLGVIIPYNRFWGTASFDANVTTQAAQIKRKVKGTALEDGVNQFQAQMPRRDALAKQIFTANGYNVPGPFSYSGLGNIELGAKVQTWKNDRVTTSILTGFRLPTATHQQDYASLLDQATGGEELDFALEVGADFKIIKNLKAGLHSRYTLPFPHSAEVPVLKDGQSGLPNLNDPSSYVVVDRKWGEYLENEAYLEYTINGAWAPYVGYTYTAKAGDYIRGPQGYDYNSLEVGTAAQSHTLQAGFSYSTIEGYVAKKVPLPFMFDFSYNWVIAGQNTPNTAYGRLDMIVFF